MEGQIVWVSGINFRGERKRKKKRKREPEKCGQIKAPKVRIWSLSTDEVQLLTE